MTHEQKKEKLRQALDQGASVEDLKNLRSDQYDTALDEVLMERNDDNFDINFGALGEETQFLGHAQRQGVPPKAASEQAFFNEYSKPIPDVQNYYANRDLLTTRGESSEIDERRIQLADEQDNLVIDDTVTQVAQGQLSTEAGYQLLAERDQTDPDAIDWYKEFYTAALARRKSNNQVERFIAEDKIRELVTDDYTATIALVDQLQGFVSTLTADPYKAYQGILTDILPYQTQQGLVQAVQKVFGGEYEFTDVIFRGQFTTKVRERLAKMSPEQRYEASQALMVAIMENEDSLSGTDYQKYLQLYSLFDPEYGLLDQYIDNAISVLDGMAVGGVAKSLWKIFTRGLKPGSNVAHLNAANPEEAGTALARTVVSDGDDLAGMTKEEIVESVVYPSHWDDPHLMPANVQDELAKADLLAKNILDRTEYNTLALTTDEAGESLKGMRQHMQSVGKHGLYDANIAARYKGVAGVDDLTFTARQSDRGFEFKATYGMRNADGEVRPFTTAESALQGAKEQFPDLKSVEILQVTKTKGFKTVPKNKYTSKARGEYVYRVTGTKNPVDVAKGLNKIFYQVGDVVTSGPLAKWFLDPAARFAKYISQGYDQAGDWSKAISADLAEIAVPFTKLNNARKREVVKLLNAYAKDPSKFDIPKLLSEAGGDTDVLSGFVSMRKTFDVLYELENRSLRRDLINQGVKSITIGEFRNMGKVVSKEKILSEIGDGISVIHNPYTKKAMQIDAKKTLKLEKDGYSFVKLKEPYGNPKQSFTYVIAKADDIGELPLNVLKKIDGYIPRYYKDTYFVRGLVRGTENGKATLSRTVVGAYPTKVEANAAIKKLKLDDRYKDIELSVAHDRSLNIQEKATLDMEDKISLQRMFYHSRGGHLPGIDGLADVSDPVEALVKNISNTANFVAHEDLNTAMKARWMSTFGHLIDPTRGFPTTAKEIGVTGVSGASKELQDAIDLWTHIKTSEGLQTVEQKGWKEFWVTQADNIIGDATEVSSLRQLMSKGALAAADHSPNQMMRTLAFYHMIAMSPLRQLYIQSQQWLFIAAVLHPKDIVKVPLQNKAVLVGLARDSWPAGYKAMKDAAAKSLGLSTKEYERFITEFKATGLPKAVDSHDFVRDALLEFSKNIDPGVGKTIARGASNVVKAPFKLAKKVGFNAGELHNLINTFLAARLRYLRKTGKSQLVTKNDFQQVAAEARSLALSMTKSGTFRYQEGFFSAITQFFSIQHKALLAMNFMTNKYANQAFTRTERFKIAMGQIFLNGITGLGLYEGYRKVRDGLGVEVAEEDRWMEDLVVGGVYEAFINFALSEMTGEDTNLYVAKHVAPASTWQQMYGDYIGVIFNNKGMLDMMAASKVMNRYYDAAKLIHDMRSIPSLKDDQDLLTYISVWGTTTSGYNNFLKGRAAMRLGYHVSNSGPTVQATYNHAIAEMLVGITPRELDEYYLLKDQWGSGTKKEKTILQDSERELSEVSEALYKNIMKTLLLHNDEFAPALEEGEEGTDKYLFQLHRKKIQDILKARTQILALFEPLERDIIWNKLVQKARSQREQGKDNLIDTLVKSLQMGGLADPDAVKTAMVRIKNSRLIDENSPKGQYQLQTMQLIMDNIMKQRTLSSAIHNGDK